MTEPEQIAFDVKKASEIALDYSSKKVVEIKKRQWDLVHSTLLIFGFLFTVAEQKWLCKRIVGVLAVLVLIYFGLIFYQAIKNAARFKNIYKYVFQQVMPNPIRQKFYEKKEGPFEDEGRLLWGLGIVVLAACIMVFIRLLAPGTPGILE